MTGCLLDLVRDSLVSGPVLLSASRLRSAGELAAEAQSARRGVFGCLRGQAVSLRCLDPGRFIEALVALDGWAGRLLLTDRTCKADRLTSLEQSIDATWRVVVRGDGPALAPIRTARRGLEMTEWVIASSGTTGSPKLTAHVFESLTRTVKAAGAATIERRWGLLYDCTRFAGLQVLLQAFGGGGRLIAPDEPSDLRSSIALLARHGCDALSATPTMWRALAIAGLLPQLDLQLVTLGGEAADQSILDTLRRAYPAARVRHIYASTEAGVGFSVSDGRAGFPAAFLERPPAGVELRVRADGVLLLRPEIRARSVGEEGPIDAAGWIDSGDLVAARGDRYLFVGRTDGAINVGGRKVHPIRVEETLLEIPGVRAARVHGDRNAITGLLVSADIVAGSDEDLAALRQRLTRVCTERLEPFEVPVRFSFVPELAVTPARKVQR